VVRFDAHPIFDQTDRHFRVSSQKLIHQAFEVGGEVLDDDERHPGVPG
jgi:hypothetical protein